MGAVKDASFLQLFLFLLRKYVKTKVIYSERKMEDMKRYCINHSKMI